MKRNKTNYIKAFKQTAEEYKEGSHICTTDKCILCMVSGWVCSKCPVRGNRGGFHTCASMKTYPLNLPDGFKFQDISSVRNPIKCSMRAEFYREAVKVAKKIPADDFKDGCDAISEELGRLDREIFNKYIDEPIQEETRKETDSQGV